MKLKIIVTTLLLALSSHASSTSNTNITSIEKTEKQDSLKGRNQVEFNHSATAGFKLNSLAYQADKKQEQNASSVKGRNLNITHFESAFALYSKEQAGIDKLVELVEK